MQDSDPWKMEHTPGEAHNYLACCPGRAPRPWHRIRSWAAACGHPELRGQRLVRKTARAVGRRGAVPGKKDQKETAAQREHLLYASFRHSVGNKSIQACGEATWDQGRIHPDRFQISNHRWLRARNDLFPLTQLGQSTVLWTLSSRCTNGLSSVVGIFATTLST